MPTLELVYVAMNRVYSWGVGKCYTSIDIRDKQTLYCKVWLCLDEFGHARYIMAVQEC